MTYVISDIHGQLDAFKEMLETIEFDINNDELYVLGDYVDWGPKSIETIQYLIDLSKHNNTHCLMGNHDKMMYDVIVRVDNGATIDEALDIACEVDNGVWCFGNGGDGTLLKYMRLSNNEKDSIKIWLSNLRYFIPNVTVNGRNFYLCHSKPFVKGMSMDDVIWQRVNQTNLPKSFLNRPDKPILVSGHTMTKNFRSFNENMQMKIYHSPNNRYINIDCGAKMLRLRKVSRLACIRLDDMKEFYVE